MVKSKKVVLKEYCKGGLLTEDLFEVQEVELPEELKEGEILVKVECLSCDPTQRIWATNQPQYMPPVAIGEVMRSLGFGRVVKSNTASFAEGDGVSGILGWQEYAVLSDSGPLKPTKTPAGVPAEVILGPCGLTAVTAYFGLFSIGRPCLGETVVVSGAAGATGSAVVQLAKLSGCKVIGIAGGPEKCKQVKELYGADHCIDYKSEDVAIRLKELTNCDYFNLTGGIDIYFDNVGGDILNAALMNIAKNGRVVVCGAISQYKSLGDSELPSGPSYYINLLMRRATMQGFIVTDFLDKWSDAVNRLAELVKQGKFKYVNDIVEGDVSKAMHSVNRLLEGKNVGKQLHKLT